MVQSVEQPPVDGGRRKEIGGEGSRFDLAVLLLLRVLNSILGEWLSRSCTRRKMHYRIARLSVVQM
jgi:hypothetical protein